MEIYGNETEAKKHFVEMRFHSVDIQKKNFNNGKSAAADVK